MASLATYYGERPIEVRLYDADEERLDLFDRFGRLCFKETGSEHSLMATMSPGEALEEADLVLMQVGENCALKYLRRNPGATDDSAAQDAVVQAVIRLGRMVPPRARVLSLLPADVELGMEAYYRLDWPRTLTPVERRSMAFQILRWLNDEEYVFGLLDENERSPLKVWLDDPTTAELITG